VTVRIMVSRHVGGHAIISVIVLAWVDMLRCYRRAKMPERVKLYYILRHFSSGAVRRMTHVEKTGIA
jgi:hypothetical protein